MCLDVRILNLPVVPENHCGSSEVSSTWQRALVALRRGLTRPSLGGIECPIGEGANFDTHLVGNALSFVFSDSQYRSREKLPDMTAPVPSSRVYSHTLLHSIAMALCKGFRTTLAE